MGMLYTAREVLALLTKNKIVTFNKASFSEAVSIGTIPHRIEHGIKKKMYDYDEVKEAIIKAGIGKPPTPVAQNLDSLKPEDFKNDDEYVEALTERLSKAPTLADANILKTIIACKLDQLKLDREMGVVVLRSEVENKAFNVSRSIRDKILTIPERLSNELASISDPHKVKELLYKEFAILLDGFSTDSYL